MIFQVILTFGLVAVGLYSIALRRRIVLLGNLATLVTIVALALVWRPDDATALANRLGIGRGADLIFYCWVVISMVMILNLHLKIRIQTETVTELVRRMAIAHPFAVAGRTSPAAGTSAGNAARADRIEP